MPAPNVTHPSPAALKAFGLGKLDAASADVVLQHLDACPDCLRVVKESSGDAFIERLRAARQTAGTAVPGKSLSGLARNTNAPASGPVGSLPPELAHNSEYERVEELGRGGMGVVYKAHNTLMGRDEVLKVMGKEIMVRPGAIDRFRREIQSAARLDHPNIVKAHSARLLGELLVFSMEYVHGDELGKLVRDRGPLPVANACYYVQQVANGLQHAHEKGMVHRDIKPANLILHRDGKRHVVKILDFGLAKMTSEAGIDSGLTGAGKMLGTPDYIAPEQIMDAQSADIRADIYSLGCTLYFLLVGNPPFSASSLYELLRQQREVDAPILNLVRPDVPAELAAIVAKMMAKNPAKRFQTPDDVSKALAPFLKPGSVATRPVPAATKPAPAPRGQGETAKPHSTSVELVAIPVVPAAAPRASSPVANAWGSLMTDSAVDKVHTAAKPVSRRKPTRGHPAWVWPVGVAGGLLFLLLALWASGVFKVKTPDGVLVVEVNEPNAEVYVDGDLVIVSWENGGKKAEIHVKPGTRKVEVKKDGFKAFGEEVTLEDGNRLILVAALGSPAPVPKKDLGSLPVEVQVEFNCVIDGETRKGTCRVLTLDIGGGEKMEFVRILKGKFTMGSPEEEKERGNDEDEHEVEITKDFYMGRYAVTQAQYKAIVGENPSRFKGDRLPVETVSWDDAVKFCEKFSTKLNRKTMLPSEAQWEYACRAGTKTPFYFGSKLNGDLANCNGNYPYGTQTKGGAYKEKTVAVGSYPANPWGLYDMSGNVYQWCQDWYGPYQKLDSTRDPVQLIKQSDNYKTLRGGSWSDFAWNCRSAIRSWDEPDNRHGDIGFRVCLPLEK